MLSISNIIAHTVSNTVAMSAIVAIVAFRGCGQLDGLTLVNYGR